MAAGYRKSVSTYVRGKQERRLCPEGLALSCGGLKLPTVTVLSHVPCWACALVVFIINLNALSVVHTGTWITKVFHALIAVNTSLMAFIAKLTRIRFAKIALYEKKFQVVKSFELKHSHQPRRVYITMRKSHFLKK